ncbi:putative ATPase/DNA-binding SARP family transcriptional activator [Micromonospora jinlongensis]|uniref:Putative ATPase/DNA-binding SARP family transcriptional activator n=1 Tax=Micromonospora jinlongensis TaxID=1287877 RepID=A0A7Z0BBS2_9ACTN|nr:BTAD domain-containing putative transcriptional regulator [Micromonospora jinlongensis]NYH41518.1 putative ATPase/DNA-binding SARP family transcriptional activator [Micromonospora jinlongensis]
MTAVQFGVLGPLAVTTDVGEPVVVPGTKVRALLADLLVNRNQVVSADRLIDDLWGEDSPANPAGALQVRVSQLRKALNDAEPGARELVESRPPGYLLRVDAVDVARFDELARCTDVERLTEALALWRGEAYADVADAEFVRAETARLAEQRLAVHERLAEARLARGEHDLVAADLAELVTRHPLREGLRAVQLRALYAAGRQSEALDSYADLRDRLAEELGLDPGPELVALHRRILEQDAALSAPPKATVIRTSLPAPLDELVGRAEALAELRELLPRQRLVTLVGPGGVGKTRLAVETARAQSLPDGVQLVELAPLPAGDALVAEQVLAALGSYEAAGTSMSPADRLVTTLRHRHLLLVLDNCEHVIDPVAELVARLLREVPGLRVLATSREPLGLTGELLWEVPPLPVPDDGDLDTVRRSAAARLFAARAAAQQRGFRLDGQSAAAVAQLCRRLDGLPLALELAATRVRALGVRGVVERLDDRFRLLTTQQRDVTPRQRTLTAVIGWSWDLLDETDRVVLARLAVFPDGCTPEAAEYVCGTDLDTLARLVDRSLVVLDDSGADPRYRLLESVAAFCLDRLTDADAVRTRHASYYTELAERADPELRGADQQRWLALLDAEMANLRSALVHGGGLRLAVALSWYWHLRGRLTEARRALAVPGDPEQETRAAPWRVGFALSQGEATEPDDVRAAVAADPGGHAAWFAANAVIEHGDLALAAELLPTAAVDRWTEAAVLTSLAHIAHANGDQATLEDTATRSAALFADLGDRWGRLRATEWVGGLADMRGDHERAAALHREGLRWAEELSLWPQVCAELSWLAWLAVQTRDYAQGRELAERAYALAVEQGSPGALVFAEMSLGLAARRDGKLDLAVTHLSHLADLGRSESQPALYLPMVLVELGYAVEQGGDPDAALALHIEAFEVAAAMATMRDAVGPLEGMAAAVRSPEVAARLLGAAAAARLATQSPAAPAERDDVDRVSDRLRAELGPQRFDALLAEGAKLSPSEARAQL